jgi:hypothetical protein
VIRAAFGAGEPGHGDDVVGLWGELEESTLVRISLVAVVEAGSGLGIVAPSDRAPDAAFQVARFGRGRSG